MKRPALQNERVAALRMAFRARKVFGTFEKRAPGPSCSRHDSANQGSRPKKKKVQVVIFHNQWLALTMLRATGLN